MIEQPSPICQNCGLPLAEHRTANFSDGNLIAQEFSVCPDSVFKAFEPIAHGKRALTLGCKVEVKKHPRRNAVWAGTCLIDKSAWGTKEVPEKQVRHHIIMECSGPERFKGELMNETDFTVL